MMRSYSPFCIPAALLILSVACSNGGSKTPAADLPVDVTATEVVDVTLDVAPDTVTPSNLFDQVWWPVGDE